MGTSRQHPVDRLRDLTLTPTIADPEESVTRPLRLAVLDLPQKVPADATKNNNQIKEPDGTPHTFPDGVTLSRAEAIGTKFHRFLLRLSVRTKKRLSLRDAHFNHTLNATKRCQSGVNSST